MIYINSRTAEGVETVSMCKTRKEARAECSEYNFSDHAHHYYTSTRASKEWREDMQKATV